MILPIMFHKFSILCLFLLSAFLLSACGEAHLESASPEDSLPHSDLPSGSLLYLQDGNLQRMELPSGRIQSLNTQAAYPRWSPDGKQMAWIADDQIWIQSEGKTKRPIYRGEGLQCLAFSSRGVSLFAGTAKGLVEIFPRLERPPKMYSNDRIFELDAHANGGWLLATIKHRMRYRLAKIDLSNGTSSIVADGCSPGIRPDGAVFMHNTQKHDALIFRDWETPENEVGQLKAPDRLRFDNQRWSNHPDWIVSVSEGESQNIILHHVPTGRIRRLTQSGSADRPDLFVQ